MPSGEPNTVAAVAAFLSRQHLDFEVSDEQYSTRYAVRSGAQRATVQVYNTAKIVVQGQAGVLKQLLDEMKGALDSGLEAPGSLLPFEIERFPEVIRERVPDIDPVIIRFVEEAIRCIRADALLGAAFMIGAASERAINLLITTYVESICDETNKERLKGRIGNRMISKRFEEFGQSYRGCQSRPTDPILSQDLEVIVGNFFQFARITRNEVGHPQIVPDLDKGVLLANLGNMTQYLERVFGLMKHFQENGVVV